MSKKINLQLITVSVITILLVSLMIIATVFDYQISMKLSMLSKGEYYSTNYFLRLSETFGECVIYGVLSLALLILYFCVECKFSSLKKIRLFKAILIIMTWGINFFAAFKIIGYIDDHIDYSARFNLLWSGVLMLVLSLAFSSFWYLIVSKIKIDYLKPLCLWAIIALATVVASQAFVQVIKPIFARVRFRAINFLGDESLFQKWYQINNVSSAEKKMLKELIGSDSYKSFPSGHTASAATLIALCAIPDVLKKFNKTKFKLLFFGIAVLYSAFIAIARIVVGAHFLSDVSFAIAITYLCYFIAKILVLKFCNSHIQQLNSTL